MRGRKQEKRSSLTSNVFSIISAIRNYAKDTEYDKKYDSAIFDKMINCVIMEYLVLWLDNDQQAKQGLVEFRKNKYKVIS